MVNDGFTDARAAERALALSYAPAAARDGVAASLALDAALGQVVRTTREPLVGQMRLTWWHDALAALDARAPPAEPVLSALSAHVVRVVPGGQLTALVEGWEMLLDPLDTPAIEGFAAKRGGCLFAAMARLLEHADAAFAPAVDAAGRGWALADLSLHLSDQSLAGEVRESALHHLATALGTRWPRALRAIGALALTARADLARPTAPPAGPRRTARLAFHRLTGR